MFVCKIKASGEVEGNVVLGKTSGKRTFFVHAFYGGFSWKDILEPSFKACLLKLIEKPFSHGGGEKISLLYYEIETDSEENSPVDGATVQMVLKGELRDKDVRISCIDI